MQKNKSEASMKKMFFVALGGFGFAALLTLMACSPAKSPSLKAVDPSLVCMGTDQVPGKAMIAIELDGKTYYGCCPKCNERLRSDKGERRAIDPLSGEAVDKADAFILEGPGGIALYFQSAETAEKYIEKMRRKNEA